MNQKIEKDVSFQITNSKWKYNNYNLKKKNKTNDEYKIG